MILPTASHLALGPDSRIPLHDRLVIHQLAKEIARDMVEELICDELIEMIEESILEAIINGTVALEEGVLVLQEE